MSTINDCGPAFPVHDPFAAHQPANADEARRLAGGMTLRDYMAIHASADDVRAQGEVIRSAQVSAGGIGILPDGWAITARYMHADAMLRARKEGGAS